MADRTSTRRVFIDDVRADGKFLRATWHPDERVFVVSTWDDNVCVGATRISADGGADLIRLLADGLASAATAPAAAAAAPSASASRRRTRWQSLVRRARAWLGPRRPDRVPTIRWADDEADETLRSA